MLSLARSLLVADHLVQHAPPEEVGDDGGAPSDEEHAPPDAVFLHVQLEGEQVENQQGSNRLSFDTGRSG